jgi:hypothetical protein
MISNTVSKEGQASILKTYAYKLLIMLIGVTVMGMADPPVRLQLLNQERLILILEMTETMSDF